MRAHGLAATAWAEICRAYPDEWVALRDVERDDDGSLRSARLLGHDRSMRRLLVDAATQPNMIVAHTQGRPLCSPRLEMTDEIRKLVRPRR